MARRRHFKQKTGDQSGKEQGIELDGTILENLPNARFRVKLDEGDTYVAATVKHRVNLLDDGRIFSPLTRICGESTL